jgi:RimJ/RimL family protein N-acetyltransferase
VLERNGFARIGLAPTYLKIAGRWQDCVLYPVINDDAADNGVSSNRGPALSAWG